MYKAGVDKKKNTEGFHYACNILCRSNEVNFIAMIHNVFPLYVLFFLIYLVIHKSLHRKKVEVNIKNGIGVEDNRIKHIRVKHRQKVLTVITVPDVLTSVVWNFQLCVCIRITELSIYIEQTVLTLWSKMFKSTFLGNSSVICLRMMAHRIKHCVKNTECVKY